MWEVETRRTREEGVWRKLEAVVLNQNRNQKGIDWEEVEEVQIPRKLLRKKSWRVNAMGESISRVIKRFRDEEAYLGDLFARNYMFIQVNPSSIKCWKNHQCAVQSFTPTPSLPSFAFT